MKLLLFDRQIAFQSVPIDQFVAFWKAWTPFAFERFYCQKRDPSSILTYLPRIRPTTPESSSEEMYDPISDAEPYTPEVVIAP